MRECSQKIPGTIAKKHGIFDGGFYGKCDGKWNYTDATGEWGCNAMPEAEPQTINVQPYKIPNTGDSNLSGDWVGFKIPTGEWIKWTDAYPEAYSSPHTEGLELRASCFQTGNENNYDKWTNVTDTWPGTDIPWIVGVQLPKDQDNGYNSYNCKFGFQQEVRDNVPRYLYWRWKQLDATTTNLNYWPSNFGDFTDSPKPIVEGQDDAGIVDTKTLDAREPQGVSNVQSWLSDHSADQVISGSPFTQFPTGDFSTETDSRHPVKN